MVKNGKATSSSTAARRAQTRANYDRLSRFYDWLSGSSEKACREAGLRLLGPGPGDKILEIGPGTGQSLVALAASVGVGGQVCGLDLSPGMLHIANRRLRQVQLAGRFGLVVGDAACTPFPAGSFDGIFAAFTLELFAGDEIPSILAECWRLIRPGGRLAVASLSASPRGVFSRGMLAAYAWTHRAFPQVVDCRPIQVREVLEAGGYQVREIEVFSMWGLPAAAALAVKV